MPVPVTRRRRWRRAALAALAAATVALGGVAAVGPAAAVPAGDPDLGPNVLVFDPSMPVSDIQARVDAVAAQQVTNQFGEQRYSLLFKPGTYGTVDQPLVIQVGYYTEVAGLGLSPTDVVINGHVDVYNQCDNGYCVALNNFWRSMSNLTINVMGQSGCYASGDFWAASQAAPVRRVNIEGGNLTFMDYCSGPSFASGGFMADSRTGFVINGSQQQYYVRDSEIGGWSNGVWNQVFSGVTGAPGTCFPADASCGGPYTTLSTTPVSREKPFLYVADDGSWNVFVPAVRHDSSGTTWASGSQAGTSLPLSSFYVAAPGDSVAAINRALRSGRNLLFEPGVYSVDRTIKVERAGTVVLGMGMATLTSARGATVLRTEAPSVTVAGLMIDAGPRNASALMVVGDDDSESPAQAAVPTALQDVFFRIGGPHAGKASKSLVVNADHTLLDDVWAWRADHGSGVGWTSNTADTGLVVNGDDVQATGLFVEHYQKTEVVWNGERGRTIFFQNEMPYDVPDQRSWRHGGSDGYAAYQVGGSVESHEAWGLGSYSFFNVGPDIHASRAFQAPSGPGIAMHDMLTIFLDAVNGHGAIDHVINDVGGSSSIANPDVPVTVVSFP
ncbi:MAG: adenylyl cyclase [Frankiales bacterium]|nr:adenylyl cyclase [Frankiales bacterium]